MAVNKAFSPERDSFSVVYLSILLRCILYKVQIEKKGIYIYMHALIYIFTVKICTIIRRRRRKRRKKECLNRTYTYTYTILYLLHPPPSQPYKILCFSKTILITIFFFLFSKKTEVIPSTPSILSSSLPLSNPSLLAFSNRTLQYLRSV